MRKHFSLQVPYARRNRTRCRRPAQALPLVVLFVTFVATFSAQGSPARTGSRCRADVGLGRARTRLDARGVGFLAPMAPNTTEENRAKNRRVEINVGLGE